MPVMTQDQHDALERLLTVAKRDTGQSRTVANFLLAWWNAPSCGGFDLTDLWAVDQELCDDMLKVIRFVAESRGKWPDALGYADDFADLVKTWRPQLIEDAPR